MPMLSTAAWVAHDAGLATAIGGTVFGKTALHPALKEVSDPQERDRVADVAWRRFSWVNLFAHVAFAASWLVGRRLLSGGEAGHTARRLTRTKDALIGTSLFTGITSIVLGRVLGKRTSERRGPEQARAGRANGRALRMNRAVDTAGLANLAANLGIAAVTAVLAMKASESPRFAAASRDLP